MHGDLGTRGLAGGPADMAGGQFEDQVCAYYLAHLVAESAGGPPAGVPAQPIAVWRQAALAADDIVVETREGGAAYVLAKLTLRLEQRPESALGKPLGSFGKLARQCAGDTGARPWERPLDPAVDRFVIAIGASSSREAMHRLNQLADITRQHVSWRECERVLTSAQEHAS